MALKALLTLALFLPPCEGWTTMRLDTSQRRMIMSAAKKEDHSNSENPCWQDLYDDDCSMSNVYGASFVAAQWIKSMPCAADIEDCDMPRDLTVPEARPEAGVDHVDVMGFLGLKKADPVDKKNHGELLP